MSLLSPFKAVRLNPASTRLAWMGLLLASAGLGGIDTAEAGRSVNSKPPNYYPIPGGVGQRVPGGPGRPGIRIHIIDESMDGQVVPARPGDRIEVHLKRVSGIPYTWTSGAIDGASVNRNGSPRTELDPGTDTGRPARFVVPFRVVAKGSTTLRFELKSFVNPSEPPLRDFTVTVIGIPDVKARKD
ncbi:MAG: protease inhibitor I42 family protein [Verrucomicrobia bacterium]|nr:protease inhibitor I42 family protein [Verrucomicrobiota bacterium]